MEKQIIINVGRQLGSGGHEIGRRLAAIFHAQFYDREILNLAAEESGFAKEVFERNDERKGFLRSFLHLPFGSNTAAGDFYQNNFSQESLFKFQSDAIRRAATEGNCVFIGRCADYVLRDNPSCTNIFVTASMDFRVSHVCERFGCSRDEACRMIEKGEASRASYYNYYTGKHWGQAESYHLCVDASLLGIDRTAEYIAQFVTARQSGAPSSDL